MRGLWEKVQKFSSISLSAENESFRPLPNFIYGTELHHILMHWNELCPILIHWTDLYPILIHCRTITYLNTLSGTITYLNTLSRNIPYLNTLTRTIPYLNTLSRIHFRQFESSANQHWARKSPSISSASQNRVLGHPSPQPIRIQYYVTRVLSQSESSVTSLESSANQNPVLRHSRALGSGGGPFLALSSSRPAIAYLNT